MTIIRKTLLTVAALSLATVLYAVLRKDLTISKAAVKAAYTTPDSHFINWRGSELHYTEGGSGMPVLMIHGFGGSSRDFALLDSLIRHRYRVIRVDLPGFGLSDYPFDYDTTTIEEAYRAYFTFLFETLHIDSCFVMGNSMGGMMALAMAAEHPEKVKKLVLFNSAGYDMEEVKRTANAHVFQIWPIPYLVEKGVPEFITAKGIERVPYDKSTVTPEKIKRVNTFWNRQGNMRHIVEVANAKNTFDQRSIATISCPTLILWGKQDAIVDVKYAERFHQDIKGSRLIIYDKCGHVPMMEKPLEVQHDVLRFFSEK